MQGLKSELLKEVPIFFCDKVRKFPLWNCIFLFLCKKNIYIKSLVDIQTLLLDGKRIFITVCLIKVK